MELHNCMNCGRVYEGKWETPIGDYETFVKEHPEAGVSSGYCKRAECRVAFREFIKEQKRIHRNLILIS